MMRGGETWPARLERLVYRALALLGVLAALALFWLHAVGIHGQPLQRLLARIDTGPLALEIDRLRIRLPDRMVCDGARGYRRGVPGAALFEAGRIEAVLDVAAGARGQFRLRRLRLTDAVLRTASWQPSRPAAAAARAETFASSPAAATQRRAPRARLAPLRLELERCRIDRGVIDRAAATLSVADGVVQLDDVYVLTGERSRAGRLIGTARIDIATSALTADLRVWTPPAAALPWVEHYGLRGLARVLARFDVGAWPPEVNMRIAYRPGPPEQMRVEGEAHVHSGSYRGVAFERADGAFSVTSDDGRMRVGLHPLSVVTSRGAGQGDIGIDLATDRVRFDAASSFDPHDLRGMLGILRNAGFDALAFRGPVRVEGRGVAAIEDHDGHDFSISLEAKEVAYGRYEFDRVTLRNTMLDATNALSDVRIEGFGGVTKAGARFVVAADDDAPTTYEIVMEADDLDFGHVIRALQPNAMGDYRGRLRIEAALAGSTDGAGLHGMTGHGVVRVRDGRIFMLPVFGELSAVLARLVPGLQFLLGQTDARVVFALADGIIEIRDWRVEGDVLSLSGRGRIGFDGDIDMTAQLRFMKDSLLVARVLQTLTYPLTKLLEFRVHGRIDEPRWRPVNFSTDLLDRIGWKDSES